MRGAAWLIWALIVCATAGAVRAKSTESIHYIDDFSDPLEIPYEVEMDDRLSTMIDQADAAIRNRQWKAAARALETIILENYGSAPVYLGLIEVYRQMGKTAEATAIADELTRQINTLGWQNELDDSAVALDGEDVLTHLRQTIARGRNARTLQLRREFAVVFQLSALSSGRMEDIIRAAVFFAGSGDENSSSQMFTEAMERFPKEIAPYQGLALLASGRGEYLRAIDYMEQALILKPGDPDTLSNLAVLLVRVGDTERVDDLLWRALLREPDHVQALQMLTARYMQQGKVDDAIASCRQAIEHNPRSANAHKRMAEILVRQRKWDDVAGHLEVALDIYPRIQSAHFYLGMYTETQGDAGKAVNHYEDELRINPDFPPALNNLAWILATSAEPALRDPERAVVLARRACERTGYQRVNLLDTLFEAQIAQRAFTGALETVERIIALLQASDKTGQLADYENRARQLRRLAGIGESKGDVRIP